MDNHLEQEFLRRYGLVKQEFPEYFSRSQMVGGTITGGLVLLMMPGLLIGGFAYNMGVDISGWMVIGAVAVCLLLSFLFQAGRRHQSSRDRRHRIAARYNEYVRDGWPPKYLEDIDETSDQ